MYKDSLFFNEQTALSVLTALVDGAPLPRGHPFLVVAHHKLRRVGLGLGLEDEQRVRVLKPRLQAHCAVQAGLQCAEYARGEEDGAVLLSLPSVSTCLDFACRLVRSLCFGFNGILVPLSGESLKFSFVDLSCTKTNRRRCRFLQGRL